MAFSTSKRAGDIFFAWTLCAGFFLGVSVSGTLAKSGDIYKLDTLGGSSFAEDVNDAGQVTGEAYTTKGPMHAWLYSGTPISARWQAIPMVRAMATPSTPANK